MEPDVHQTHHPTSLLNYNIYKEMKKHCPFLQVIGVDVVNVCANFVVTGIKQDNNTKLKMPHSHKSEEHVPLEMKMQKRLREILLSLSRNG